MFAWSWEPSILIGLTLQIGAYLACAGPLRRWFPGSVRVPQHQVQLFLLGVLILFIALVSPLGILSDGYLFSAKRTSMVKQGTRLWCCDAAGA